MAGMDPILVAVIAGAVVAGFVQGLSGFAFGMVAMAFWAWLVAPQLAGPLVVFCSLLGQLMAIGSVRGGFERRLVLPFIAGGVMGVPLGAALLPQIDQTAFKAAIGGLLLLWCPIMLFAGNLPQIQGGGRLADGVVGMVGGIMGGLGGLSGPAPTLWSMLRGWSKDTQRAVIQSFNLAMHLLTATVYIASGLVTIDTLRLFAVAAPAMIVPVLLGARLYARLSQTAFRQLILILLLFAGIGLLASSIPRLVSL
jgi:uncharacterized membrane protein YfcA